MKIAMGIILLVASVFLIIAVLIQQGKSKNLSGAIAGGAETFFGKSKANSMNKKLSILTSVVAVIFVIIVLVFYISQDVTDYSGLTNGNENSTVQTGDHDHDHDDTTAVTNAVTAAE